VPPKVKDNRYVDIAPASPGTASISGYLRATDGAALDQRLDALAATVCEADPRTKEQRRADACGPLARGEATLACQCGSEDCPAAADRNSAAAAASAVIHVLAEQATIEATSNQPGYLPGFGVLPAESVRDLAQTAKLKPLTIPTDATPDPGYRPSAVTREFLQWRDLTCRWPGCDRPVAKCDVDHTVPYPDGLTHPSDLKHYCRTHHLRTLLAAGWIVNYLTGRRLGDWPRTGDELDVDPPKRADAFTSVNSFGQYAPRVAPRAENQTPLRGQPGRSPTQGVIVASQNVETAKKGYEAFGAGDVETALADFDDNIEWTIPGNSTLSGTYRGKDQFMEMLGKAAEKNFTTTPERYLADGDDVVVITRTTAGGESALQADVLTYRNGKVVKAVSFGDTALQERVFGSK
jgi:ketosteroid isomerase-like protein